MRRAACLIALVLAPPAAAAELPYVHAHRGRRVSLRHKRGVVRFERRR